MVRTDNLLLKIDWISVLLCLILIFLGWISIYAAVYNEEHGSIVDISQRYGKQLLWITLAIFLASVVFILDVRFYSVFAYFIFAFMILLLVFVLVFGTVVHGAKSWFEIGPIRLQPAEFTKFATGLALAKLFSSYNFKIHSVRNLALIALIIFLPATLIILQNDTGSALVYLAFVIVIYREGLTGVIPLMGIIAVILFVISLFFHSLTVCIALLVIGIIYHYLQFHKNKESLIAIGSLGTIIGLAYAINEYTYKFPTEFVILFGTLLFGVWVILYSLIKKLTTIFYITFFVISAMTFSVSVDYIFHNVLEKHQRTRINVLFGFEQDIKGAGYNVHQSKIAIGSGGLTGKGFLKGTQTKFDFVPEQSTDFIFCTIGEEWGFFGTSFVIIVFTVLFIRLIMLAERQRSVFSRVYGYSVVSVLFFHLAVNIGMTIGLVPVIGIPLPFFSYGGSSLWGFTVLVFIFLRLDASRDDLLI